MKFMLNELNKLVDLSGKTREELVDIFTSLAFEVEGIEKASQVSGLRLAKTFDRIPHPDADALSLLKTEIDGKTIEVICGADNIDSNQIVAHAIPGSNVGDMTMAPKKLRGITSNGMIVSIAEIIGVDQSLIEEPEVENIITFPKDTNLDQNVNVLLGIDKDIIELDILPDRQYAATYFSMAREIAAYLGIKYDWPIEEVDGSGPTNITIELGENANAVFATNVVLKDIETPMWIKILLYHSGIKPMNNITDLSAYVMLMTGAVTYIIDRTDSLKLEGRKINKIDLFNSPVKLNSTNKALLVTASSNHQSNFMNEKELNVPFGAKQIRGTTTESAELSSKLFLSLADQIGYLESLNSTAAKFTFASTTFEIEPDFIFNYLGQEFELKIVQDKLRDLDFEIQGNKYIVPSYRRDIKYKADIVEEIARFYGIQNITPKPFEITSDKFEDNLHKNSLIKISEKLTEYGLHEIKTYQLVTDEQANKYNIWQNKKFTKLRNDYSFEFNTLQTSLLSGLIDSFRINFRKKKKDIRMFELGNVFHNEKSIYSIGMLHNEIIKEEEPILATKELTLMTLESINVDLDKISFVDKEYEIFNPFISSSILFDGKEIGCIGEIHPSILREHKFIRIDKIMTKLYYVEIQIEELF